MDQKSVSKSIRLTPELFNYIDSYRGKGFNEKFSNVIQDACNSDAARKKHLERLDKQIQEREALLSDIGTQLSEMQRLLRRATGSGW